MTSIFQPERGPSAPTSNAMPHDAMPRLPENFDWGLMKVLDQAKWDSITVRCRKAAAGEQQMFLDLLDEVAHLTGIIVNEGPFDVAPVQGEAPPRKPSAPFSPADFQLKLMEVLADVDQVPTKPSELITLVQEIARKLELL